MPPSQVSKEQQAVQCTQCPIAVPVSADDNTADGDTSRHTYLGRCGHVFCATCYENLEFKSPSTLVECNECKVPLNHKDLKRVYFDRVWGPASDEIRDLQTRIAKIRQDNEEMKSNEQGLRDRFSELTRQLENEADKLEKAIKDMYAALKLIKRPA